jgi:hypothetical protein
LSGFRGGAEWSYPAGWGALGVGGPLVFSPTPPRAPPPQLLEGFRAEDAVAAA